MTSILSRLAARGTPTAHYFYVLKDDHIVSRFCVADARDPDQFVETTAPDGTRQRWAKREEGDLLVFYPPDGYRGAQGMLWSYDRRLQIGEPMPREKLERLALRNRVSLPVPVKAPS